MLHYQNVREALKKCPIFSSVMSYIPVGYVLYFWAECPIFFGGGADNGSHHVLFFFIR